MKDEKIYDGERGLLDISVYVYSNKHERHCYMMMVRGNKVRYNKHLKQVTIFRDTYVVALLNDVQKWEFIGNDKMIVYIGERWLQ